MDRFAEFTHFRTRRVGTVDQLAQHLREMISDGRLARGDRLLEVPMSEALGVSRNTLRDAIRVLGSEGLVEHELHRGAVVRTLGPDDVKDIFGIRRMLELRGLAALPETSDGTRERLHEALQQVEESLAAGNYTALIEHELEFHAAIVGLLESERLDRFFSQVLAELRLLLGGASDDAAPAASRRLVSVYRRVVRAADNSEYPAAAKLLSGHLDRYERRYAALVARESAAPATASPRA